MSLPIWTRQRLHDLIETKLNGYKFIVVSNREPFIHRRGAEGIECIRPASGMAAALHPIVVASAGTWIAHGSGDADREVVDANDRVQVPPEAPSYTLRRVWLEPELEKGFYYGLSNDGLWPLCHITFTRPIFRPEDWAAYRTANDIFARAVIEEAAGKPAIVFVQDYHFCLLPRMLKKLGGGNLIVAMFWHIPWPNREVFRAFPWGEELLDGMLGNDLLGFHIRYHCQNFRDTVDRHIEARVDNDASRITRGGEHTLICPFPISIDFDAQDKLACSPAVETAMEKWRTKLQLGERLLGAGIERLDYTKGISQRLLALDYFFEHQPEWRGKVCFIQIAAPSRSQLRAYQQEERDVDEGAALVNERWGTADWQPVTLIKEHFGPADMAALHRLSRFFMVNSLHDGMNLVAKEFIASRHDERGVLLLSKFTGAARELAGAVDFNPFALNEIADSIRTALEMPDTTQQKRMHRLREQVAYNNVYRWAGKILSTLRHFELPDPDYIENTDELDAPDATALD